MVFVKPLFFGFAKNYFRATLIEKYCLGLETSLCFSSKACMIGSKEENFFDFISWMDVVVRAYEYVDKLYDSTFYSSCL